MKKKKNEPSTPITGHDYEPVHPHTPRMAATDDQFLGVDAVGEAQGYGSRPSSPDFVEGPLEIEHHVVVTNLKNKSLPAKIIVSP